jgi:hypothetical protein
MTECNADTYTSFRRLRVTTFNLISIRTYRQRRCFVWGCSVESTTDGIAEFPESWFVDAKLARGRRDCSLNYFGVDASQPLSIWRQKGWIYPDDPRGWFQWYCRYYLGRRLLDEDARQIRRWKAMRRHIAQIKRNCEAGDLTCRPRQRQALLHWAYDSRQY